jgi:hypothetical protein
MLINILELEGKIKEIPAETKKGLDNATRYGTDKTVLEDRENIALEIISKSKNPLDILIYGGAHQFGDNINEWNEKNPGKKYSLIEVTPENYKR